MIGTEKRGQLRGGGKTFGIGFIIGAVLAATAILQFDPGKHEAKARIVRGMVERSNHDGTVIVVNGEGYSIADRPWRDLDGSQHSGSDIGCIPGMSSGAEVELGVIDLAQDEGTVYPVIAVWVRCLSPPSQIAS